MSIADKFIVDRNGRYIAMSLPGSTGLVVAQGSPLLALGMTLHVPLDEQKSPGEETLENVSILVTAKDAWSFAQAILATAREREWGFPDLQASDRPLDKRDLN